MAAVDDLGGADDRWCKHCFRSRWRGGRCKRRSCPGYAPIYLRDQAERLRVNLPAWHGQVCMATLTAPGRDALPWDRSRCAPGKHRCSGTRGCKVVVSAAARWNSTVTERLSGLLDLARERVRRQFGKQAQVVVLGYVLEAHGRGVFHVHLVLGYQTAADRAALDTFRGALKDARGRYGFGMGPRSFDAGEPHRFNAGDAARYVTKYLRPDGAKSSFVPLLQAIEQLARRDPETGRSKVLVRPVYVNPKLTQITGVTMGFLRFRRYAWVRWGLATGLHRERWARRLTSHDELVATWKLYQRVRSSEMVGLDPPKAAVLVEAPPTWPAFEQLSFSW